MASDNAINVEVVYAEADRQHLYQLRVPRGSDVRDVLRTSGILERFAIDLQVNPVGVFGEVVRLDRVLVDGDRVEIYRPLKADPKEIRRRLAAEGKTMASRRRAPNPPNR